ncbi:MAG: hypothetical protein R3E44_05750 [Paracoccaceae bacterium]
MTVDWVVLAAAVIAALTAVKSGTRSLSGKIGNDLSTVPVP